MLAQEFDVCRADLFVELSQSSVASIFTRIDSALGQLPGFLGLIDPLADKDASIAVEHHHAGARAIGKIGGTLLAHCKADGNVAVPAGECSRGRTGSTKS